MEYVNLLLYSGLLYYLYRFKPQAVFAKYIVSIWAFASLIGLYYVNSENYREGLEDVTLLPFIYLFICFFILLYGFCEQKEIIHHVYYGSNKLLKIISWGLCLLALFPFCEMVYALIDLFISGKFLLLGANYDSLASGESDALVSFSKYTIVSMGLFRGLKIVAIVLFFYFLQEEKIDKLLLSSLLILSLQRALQSVCYGNRTELIWFVLYFIGMWRLLNKTLSTQGKKFLTKIIIIGTVVFGSILIGLTIGRYIIGLGKSNSEASDAVMQYTAESIFSFNNSMFYENGDLGGYSTMLPIMQTFGLTKVKTEDLVDYNRSRMRGKPEIFYTIIGDFYNDFGAWGTLFIVIMICCFIRKIHIHEEMTLWDMIYLSTFIYIISNSLFYFCMKTYYTPVYVNILFAIIVKLFERKKI